MCDVRTRGETQLLPLSTIIRLSASDDLHHTFWQASQVPGGKMSFLRRALVSVEAAILSSKQSMGVKLNIPPEKDIFLFDSRAATSEWIMSTDRSIGGLSEARWGFYDPTVKASLDDSEDRSRRPIYVKNEDGVASAVFNGRLSLACQPTEAGIVRSGYCAVRGTLPRGLLLHGYEGISMRIMTDGREYRLNAQMDGWNPMNLYMGFIRTPANEWVDVELPFRDFMLTAKGYYKFNDSTPLNPANLRSIGIAIADQKEGDFEFRIQWIKALAKVDSREIRDEDLPDSDEATKRNAGFKKPSDFAI